LENTVSPQWGFYVGMTPPQSEEGVMYPKKISGINVSKK
jgi:hypothetical protein